nr:hypothetical protein [uncultured Draconibacterium sp.]
MATIKKLRKNGQVVVLDQEPGIYDKTEQKKLAKYLKTVYKPGNKILALFWGTIMKIAVKMFDDFILDLIPEKIKESIKPAMKEFVNEL